VLGVLKGQKSFEKGSWSYAIDYGVGGKSPLEPSFNFCVEICDNSKVSYHLTQDTNYVASDL